jgi:L-asparaginase
MAEKVKKILVLATGGTIAGKAGDALRPDYRPGQIAIGDYLEQVSGFDLGAELVGEQIANIGSEDIGPDIWRQLYGACRAALADDDLSGVIITHGTDTLEETAFLLDLTLPTNKPVVLVGAMRPADAVGYDGFRNFANAVRVAKDPDASGRGVLVVMGDRVFAARDVRKGRTSGTDAFRGFPRESVAMVTPAALDWFGAAWRSDHSAQFLWHDDLPEVVIMPSFAGASAEWANRLVKAHTRGVVVAGVGEGNMANVMRERLAAMAKDGMLVVRTSRSEEGLVNREPEDADNLFVAGRALNAQKARILLQVLIANGIEDLARVQRAFDSR